MDRAYKMTSSISRLHRHIIRDGVTCAQTVQYLEDCDLLLANNRMMCTNIENGVLLCKGQLLKIVREIIKKELLIALLKML